MATPQKVSDDALLADDAESDPQALPGTRTPAPGLVDPSKKRRTSSSASQKAKQALSSSSNTTTTVGSGHPDPRGLQFAWLFAQRYWAVGTTYKPALLATLFCANVAWLIKTFARLTGLHSHEDEDWRGKNKDDTEFTWRPRRFTPARPGACTRICAFFIALHSNVRVQLEYWLAPIVLPQAHLDYFGAPQSKHLKIKAGSANQKSKSSQPGASDIDLVAITESTYRNDKMSTPWTRSPRLEGVNPPMPECWGHRGASAAYPENTIASFEMAIRDGAEGLESDVHITSDDVVIMFHDPSLERTTNGSGTIREQPWYEGIENVRTKATPQQQIPTFYQVCELLMRPGNRHVKLNIDIKPENDPDRLFRLMKESVESFPNFAEDLSPRLILGLWHPKFLRAALAHVPTLRRVHIGGSPVVARTYFWKHCDGFSMWFPSLVSADGQNFLEQARREGKDVFVWTVNRRDEMVEATRWGVKAILTDETAMMQTMRREMNSDYVTTRSERVGMFFRWATWRYWMLPQFLIQSIWISELERRAGITFKQAWKDGELQSNDPPAAVEAAYNDASAGEQDSASTADRLSIVTSDNAASSALDEKSAQFSNVQQANLSPVAAAA